MMLRRISELLLAGTLLLLARGTDGQRYSEIEELGASCSPRDKCVTDNRSGYRGLCQCDPFCTVYGDCCVDVPNRYQLAPRAESFSCFALTPVDGVFVRDSCPSGWTNLRVRSLCENPSPRWDDPFNHFPITSYHSLITYRNFYCAICNGEALTSVMWSFSLTCKTTNLPWAQNFFKKSIDEVPLRYNHSDDRWVVQIDERSFAPCDIRVMIPKRFKRDELRTCYPNIIDRCAPSWRNTTVRNKCAAYMGVLFGSRETIYRNVHCAICNHAEPRNLSCEPDFGGGVDSRPAPFPILLDFTGDPKAPVGKKRRCPQDGVKWDPFHKKCRDVFCGLPKYVIRNGICVRGQ